jgi:hypothetical protein
MEVVKFEPKKEMIFKSIYKRDYFNYHKKCKKDFFFLVGDIEAHINENGEFVFELGIFFDGVNFHICYDLLEYYNEINNYFNLMDIKTNEKNIYFHNLDFDIIFFLKKINFANDITIINSGNMMLKFKDENFNFLNSLSILPMSLKQVVKIWLKIDFKEWENQKEDVLDLEISELERYCKRDCFLLFFAIFKLKNIVEVKYNIKNFLTIPGLSIKIFKSFYNQSNFLENKKLSFFDEGYYFGGHTEKFFEGTYHFKNHGLNYFDVNSLYPFIMRDIEINQTKFKMIKPTLKNLFKLIYNDEIFFIDCKIEIKHDNFRVIPVQFEQSNYYPKGIFECKISNHTVKFLLKHKHFYLKEIYGLVAHEKNIKEKIFFNYVNDFYKLRKEDKQNDLIYKLLLNSLYGKFGQNEVQTKTILNPESVEGFSNFTQFNENLICSKDEKAKYRIDYLRKDIAGMITEKARLYMAENRIKCFKRGLKTYYQDTDSLIVNGNFQNDYVLKELQNDKELGKFKKENKKVCNDCYIIGLKVYRLDENLSARKGIKNIKPGDYKSLAYALELHGLHKKKYIRFFEDNERVEKIDLTKYPNLLFYNDRFTKPKTFIRTGFFGIKRVPFYITKISEKLDKLPLDYYIKNKIFL